MHVEAICSICENHIVQCDLLQQQVNNTGAIRNNGSSIYWKHMYIHIYCVGVHVSCQLRQLWVANIPTASKRLRIKGRPRWSSSISSCCLSSSFSAPKNRSTCSTCSYTIVYIYIQRICKWHLCTYQCACELQRLHTHSVRPTHCIKKWHC